MPKDFIASRLKAFRVQSKSDQQALEEYCKESPFERTKREVRENLARSEKYRASVLRNVTTFAGLNPEAILAAAQSMEEVFYKKGDIVIQQDDIGDSFFVLEEGVVSVTRKANMRDPNERPRELTKLGKNAHFGEIALLTAEPRSATVTVVSDEAKCLRMTKHEFEELLATTNKLQAENRRQIGRDVLDTVPLFKNMTSVNKKKLLEAMIPMTYLPGSYICRQGTTGNSFFILTEGGCRVTINTSDHNEREVATLRAGDFFGEVALIEASNRRTANVISNNTVSCLTLSRSDFNRMLRNLKVKIMEHQAMRNANAPKAEASENKHMSSLSRKRRISGFNTHGQRDEVRISNLFKRYAKFTSEAMWNSLYSRFFRDLLLDGTRMAESGKYASLVMRGGSTRFEAVQNITEQCVRILEMDSGRRTSSEHAFIVGLLKTRNHLREKLCKAWPPHQFVSLCKKLKFVRVKPFRKIVEADTRGTTAFLIVRGAVRIFGMVKRGEGQAKAYFEEDMGPGEVFGEAALSGMHTRMLTAMSLTPLELIVIDDQDYMTAQDRDTQLMGTEERSRFLTEIPLFRDWDSYKLIRLAHALVQEEIPKQTVLCTHHAPNKDLYFIVHGKVDVVDNLEKKNVITSLLAHDYCGESGLINRFIKAINKKVQEEFYAVAATRLDVLVLQEASFHLFDLGSLEGLKSAFEAKLQWRKERVQAMKWERAKVRKQYYIMHCEATMMENGLLKRDDETKSSTSEQTLPILSPRHTSAATTAPFPAPSTPLLVPGKHSELIEEPASRPPSPIDMQPALAAVRPLSPSRTNEPAPVRELAAVDQAYKTALVHPLDERLQSDDVWRLPPPKAPPTIEELKDIPQLFAKDYDMLMLSSAIRDLRTLNKVQESVWMARKPASAKKRAQFKQDIIVRFPLTGEGGSRPSTGKKRATSPNSPSPTRDKLESHKDIDNFVLHDDDVGDHPIDHIEGLISGNNQQDPNVVRAMRHSFDVEKKEEPEIQFFVKSLQHPVSASKPVQQSAPSTVTQIPTAQYRPSTAPLRPQATAPPNALSQALIRMNSQKLQLNVEMPSSPLRKASIQNNLGPLHTPTNKSMSKWSSASMDVNIAASKDGEEKSEWGLLVHSMNLASPQPQHRSAIANSKSLPLGPGGRRSQSAQRTTYRIQAAQRLMVASKGPLVNKNSRLIHSPNDSYNVSANNTIASMSEHGQF